MTVIRRRYSWCFHLWFVGLDYRPLFRQIVDVFSEVGRTSSQRHQRLAARFGVSLRLLLSGHTEQRQCV